MKIIINDSIFFQKDDDMKFFIAEQNIGDDATKEQAEILVELLKKKGWDVEYGIKRNVATDVSEFGQEDSIQDAFANDFMLCLSEIEGIE
ncbi:MAG: hypothetical protein JRD87_02425 [Deltaproteobacteria bacterium]|nr:hypothetical protein [Deltaproteobacteria bacterium]MBW2238165.1 hypothetical protein [Deltaproteobacteria bacterium]MBW2668740.1 hypothetical protein [Deltaproteobacteria bacterium]